jgi:hypothetical protein
VTAEVEGDDLCFARLLTTQRFVNNGSDGVRSFRGRDNAFRAGKNHCCLKDRELGIGNGFNNACIVKQTDKRCHPVIPQSTCVNSWRDKSVTEGVHLQKRCHASSVAEVVSVNAFGQTRRSLRFNSDDAQVWFVAVKFVGDEGEVNPAKLLPPPTQPTSMSG